MRSAASGADPSAGCVLNTTGRCGRATQPTDEADAWFDDKMLQVEQRKLRQGRGCVAGEAGGVKRNTSAVPGTSCERCTA